MYPLHLWVQEFISFKNLLGQRYNLSSPVKFCRHTNHSSAIFFTGAKTPCDYFSLTFLDPDSRVFFHHRSSSITATALESTSTPATLEFSFSIILGWVSSYKGSSRTRTAYLPSARMKYLLSPLQVTGSIFPNYSSFTSVCLQFLVFRFVSLLYAYLELHFRSSFQIGSLYCLQIYLSCIIVNCVILHISIPSSLCSWFNSALGLFVSWSIVPYIS